MDHDRAHGPTPNPLDPAWYAETMDAVARWGAGYLRTIGERPLRAPIEPGALLASLPASPPESPEPGWDGVLDDVRTLIEPNLVHWQHPGFFAFFPCNASVPAIAGDVVAGTLGVNGMLWATAPAATELEMRMMDWCAELFGLPVSFRFDASGDGGGVIQATASEAAIAALVAARAIQVRAGAPRDRVTVYTSEQAHSSIVKAAMICGLADDPEDRSRVRLIPTDGGLRMDPGALRAAIERDRADGLAPALVVATLGTTSTGAFDPLRAIASVIEGASAGAVRPWLHVDAAWAGSALVCPELRGFAGGLEHADSLCVNPHKWLLTNFDCDLFWTRRRADLTRSMSITPAYLRDDRSEAGAVVDYRDWHVPLGRKMRALKLWFVIRRFGGEGLRAHIRGHVALAERVERGLRTIPGVDIVFERSLALVCFRLSSGDDATRRAVERVNAGGRSMLTATRVPIGGGPAWIARVAVGSSTTDAAACDRLIEDVRAACGG